MNITELDSYNLADAVKFNDKLNPAIWQGQQMRPEVRQKLLAIAEDFREFLGLSDLNVKDITVSGSNAGFTYTPHSDIDLHLVVDIPQADSDEVYRELFDAKKYQYNEQHNISIGGYDVELYVENANQPPVSQGTYSVLNDDWIKIPKQRRATVDDDAVRSKFEDLGHRIESAVASNDHDTINKLAHKIKKMRQAGLDEHGELGSENLAFKILRTQGLIKKLYDAKAAARDAELSLKERAKVKPRFNYGYKSEDLDTDGVMMTQASDMSNESAEPVAKKSVEEIITDFVRECSQQLGLENTPKLKLKKDPAWAIRNKSFGRYDPDTDQLIVAIGNRHIMDVLRTIAHELVHQRQDEVANVPSDAGTTGSKWENEANAKAGVVMRNFADANPEHFADAPVTENASGYIPTKKQAKDSRFKMALSVDVHPGQVGKEANKLGLETDKQGKPALMMASANLLKEFQEFKEGLLESQDLFEVKMTGSNLEQLAKAIKGVQVGLEFEMIVPNTDLDSDDADLEPDYDQDERVYDIDDAVNFFDDGIYNSSTELRRLRDNMESDYEAWCIDQVDNAWAEEGYEFFKDYVEREDAFDRDDAMETARDEIIDEHPELDTMSPEFNELMSRRVAELEEDFIRYEWEEQGHWYQQAQEEFNDEQYSNDNYSERDWLSDQDIRWATNVESQYGHVTWPHYTSQSDDDIDIKKVALNFLENSGLPYKTIAVATAYHANNTEYEKWDPKEKKWYGIGKQKPDDCFTIEPDGSLDGDNPGDAGLEFVSPKEPLDQAENTMNKVQQWAAKNGAYTGLDNKTSLHTNVSIPGYSIEDLDYLKAALLLGDEHVLRQFDRIGNTYANPAIEKVKQLAKNKPEKAKELLDKMKSQLNAAASKILHSGVTDKFTSINTKGNRIEFRSPGGDYLDDIAERPKKLLDTINRFVVVMDAAMDPNKYKEEYQKKLYKVLTGDIGSRKASTGNIDWTVTSKANIWDPETRKQKPVFTHDANASSPKDAWNVVKGILPPDAKESDYTITPNKIPTPGNKDLLNVFSRYAAGEMPKAALKSFLRQTQLQRKKDRNQLGSGKYWWNATQVGRSGRIEIVAKDEKDAKLTAAKAWGFQPTDAVLNNINVEVLRPFDEDEGKYWWKVTLNGQTVEVVSKTSNDAKVLAASKMGLAMGLNTTDQMEVEKLRPYTASEPQGVPGLYKIFDTSGRLIAGDEYGSNRAALARAGVWAMRQGIDVVVKNAQGEEIGRVSSSGEITPTERTAQNLRTYNIYNRDTGQAVKTIQAHDDDEAEAERRIYAEHGDHGLDYDTAMHRFGVRFVPGSTGGAARNASTANHNWCIRNRDTQEVLKTFHADGYQDAYNVLEIYKQHHHIPDSDNSLVYGPYDPAEEQAPQALDHIAAFGATPVPGSTLDLQRQRAAQSNDTPGNFNIEDPNTGNIVRNLTNVSFRQAHQAAEEMNQQAGRGGLERYVVRQAPAQQQEETYNVYDQSSGYNVSSVTADSNEEAIEQFNQRWPNAGYVLRIGQQTIARSGETQQSAANTPPAGGTGEGLTGNWGFWMTNADRFARWPGEGHGLRRFSSREVAQQWLDDARAQNPRMRTDIEIREIEPERTPVGDINLFPELEPTQQQAAQTGGTINTATEPTTGSEVGQTYTPSGSSHFLGSWLILDPNDRVLYRFSGIGNNQSDANRVAMVWLQRNPRQMVDGVTVVPEMS